MNTSTPRVETVSEIAAELKKKGVIHLVTDDVPNRSRRTIMVNGLEMLNFTSCSYLGLESDARLCEGAKKAIEKYGVQFDCSRAYVSLHLYDELETLLSKIFEKPVIVTTSVTSGHLSCLPSLVSTEDAIISDHQVHASVQMAVDMVKARGTYVELIRHSRLDYLENRVQKLSKDYKKIWYMVDGVYSMYGDITPIRELNHLMDKYPQLHLYVDDAHGMSWAGKNGSGAVLSKADFHPNMVLVTSLGKAFGSSGGVAVFPDMKSKTLVRDVGNTLIFTSPLTPPILGAAVESAKIHLSPEIYEMQNTLRERMRYFQTKAMELGLPLISKGESPVAFLGLGKMEVAQEFCRNLMDAGFFTCIAVYPSVPYNQSGIRLMSSLYHSNEDIDQLLTTMASLLPKVLEREKSGMDQINRAFGRLAAAEAAL